MSRPVNQIRAAIAAQNQQVALLNVMFYSYTLAFVAAPTGQTSIAQMTIQADSDFFIQQTVINTTSTTDISALSNCTIQLTDSGSGMNLFDQAIPVSNVFGTAQLPFIWPTARMMQKNATLTGSLFNNTGSNVTFYMSFHGQRVYNYG